MVASLTIALFFVLCAAPVILAARNAQADPFPRTIHHEIDAKVSPGEHLVTLQDRISLPGSHPTEFSFLLHEGMHPVSLTRGVNILREGERREGIRLESFRVKLPAGLHSFVLRYGGTVNHPLESFGREQAGGIRATAGIISEDGIYLGGNSCWYPAIEGELLSFSLQVELPSGWDAVSQGGRTVHRKEAGRTVVRWESPEPQEEIYLVAARFTEYTRSSNRIQAMVFLRRPDRELAEKYLDATIGYLSMYEKLIGPYPYQKFALVENFWETGFGMPSFTLLGPKIIRFPFILTSSYPHEILHNWWGNSVFPDYRTGNWSEGLTAYLADHLIREQEGDGVEYRQTTLQKYADYAASGRDFPLTQFRSRHGSSSEAVGYGKSLMFFHMLRLEVGDGVFVKALRDFYKRNIFRTASFGDLRSSFERVSGKPLGREFRQWVERPGAPHLRLRSADVSEDRSGYVLRLGIEQDEPGDAYLLRIPVAVTMEGREEAYQTVINMDGRIVESRLRLPSKPQRVDLDPEFDLFRMLDRNEIPPAISSALGAKEMLILLPSSADGTMLKAYQDFAKMLGESGPDHVEIKLDSELKELPRDRAVAVLGWKNLFARKVMSELEAYGVSWDKKTVHVLKREFSTEKHSAVFVARNPRNKDMAVMFIASGLEDALPGLGRKLPHYQKYSYLGFEGDEPANIFKGRWPVVDSPMTAFLPGKKGILKVGMGRLQKRKALVSPPKGLSPVMMPERFRAK